MAGLHAEIAIEPIGWKATKPWHGMESSVNCADYIVPDKAIYGGKPVVKGTRVAVRTVLACLAEGASTQEILADFPTLTERAVRAIITSAAASAEEDLPLPSILHKAGSVIAVL